MMYAFWVEQPKPGEMGMFMPYLMHPTLERPSLGPCRAVLKGNLLWITSMPLR